MAALGTATDPYQPIEGHYKLSRGTLEALVAGKTPVGLVTKGPMIVRDIDVLQDALPRGTARRVYVSVPTTDRRRLAHARTGNRASAAAAARRARRSPTPASTPAC